MCEQPESLPYIPLDSHPPGPSVSDNLVMYFVQNDPRADALVAEPIRKALIKWARFGEPAGDFVMSVLRNDLREAAGRADLRNAVTLPAIVMFCNTHLPDRCWGSEQAVAAWEMEKAKERHAQTA